MQLSRRSFLEATAVAGLAATVNRLVPEGLVSSARAAEAAKAAPAAAAAGETKIVKTCCRACIHNCGVLAHAAQRPRGEARRQPRIPDE